MKKTLIASVCLFAATLGFTGCRHRGTLPVQQTTSPVVGGIAMTSNVKVVRGVSFGPTVIINDGNVILAQTQLTNNTKARVVIKYKFEWFDANGMQLPSTAEGWMEVQVESKELKTVQAVSPSPNAKNAVIKAM